MFKVFNLKWFYEESDLSLSVKEVETRFAISNQTTRNDLSGLEAMGYLEMIDLNKKQRDSAQVKDSMNYWKGISLIRVTKTDSKIPQNIIE